MTVTITLENESSESAESVNIAPFNRSNWTLTDTDVEAGAISSTEYKVAGDSTDYPLVRRMSVRKTTCFHPGHENDKMDGRRYRAVVYTTAKIEDDVANTVQYVPVSFEVAINHGGSVIMDPDTSLDMLLSTVALLYPSVSTGDPAVTTINKLALGATEI